jgi:hypothetical protein
MAGLGLFYLAIGAGAATAGLEYGVAGLVAGTIPLTALALIVATTGQKTVEEEGRRRDASGDPEEDSVPGIGLDDDTPLGDTPEHAGGEEGFHRNHSLERAHREKIRER